MSGEVITLGQVQRFEKWARVNENSNDVHWKILEVFFSIPRNEAMKLPIQVVNTYTDAVGAILSSPSEELIRSFNMDVGEETIRFGFHPNLSQLTLGEYVDASMVLEPENHHKLMAVLYRPIPLDAKEDWQLPEYNGTTEQMEEAMKDMPYLVYKSAMFFFIRLATKLRSIFLSYSHQVQAEAQANEEQNSEQSGDGIPSFMPLLKEMSYGWMMLQDSPFMRLCNGWSLRKKRTA